MRRTLVFLAPPHGVSAAVRPRFRGRRLPRQRLHDALSGLAGDRLRSLGKRIGPEFRVNASTSSSNVRSIAEDANGIFIVVYELVSGASGVDVYRRRFAALIPGDVDGNGVVDVLDVFYLINFLPAGRRRCDAARLTGGGRPSDPGAARLSALWPGPAPSAPARSAARWTAEGRRDAPARPARARPRRGEHRDHRRCKRARERGRTAGSGR